MKENTKKGVSRREFLGLSALGLASLTILPSWAISLMALVSLRAIESF